MSAKRPEEICGLFQKYMADGDLESLLNVYDDEAVFLSQSGEVKIGKQEIREALAPLASAKTIFSFNIRQIVHAGDIALMHSDWQVSSPQPMFVHAIEVARRQTDGTWRWLIGDPFTVDRRVTSTQREATL